MPQRLLTTERRNERTLDIDRVGTDELLRLINSEDAHVPGAVAACLPELGRLVDETARRVEGGGRLHYAGAGTSGRIGVLDAAELLSTFGLGGDVVVAHNAGGDRALRYPVDRAEDSEAAAHDDLAGVRGTDVVVGLAASGRTPYVAGALRAAREVGAFTALVTANSAAPLRELADLTIVADTGPEVIAGSTRMKAATAQKLILNTLSTALAIKLGRTLSNLMVDMSVNSDKLRDRSIGIIVEATGQAEDECSQALERADGEVKTALTSVLLHCSAAEARARLAASGGRVRAATGN